MILHVGGQHVIVELENTEESDTVDPDTDNADESDDLYDYYHNNNDDDDDENDHGDSKAGTDTDDDSNGGDDDTEHSENKS